MLCFLPTACLADAILTFVCIHIAPSSRTVVAAVVVFFRQLPFSHGPMHHALTIDSRYLEHSYYMPRSAAHSRSLNGYPDNMINTTILSRSNGVGTHPCS